MLYRQIPREKSLGYESLGAGKLQVERRPAVRGAATYPALVGFNDRSGDRQAQAGVARTAFSACRIGAIEPVEQFLQMFRRNGLPRVLQGQNGRAAPLIDLHLDGFPCGAVTQRI